MKPREERKGKVNGKKENENGKAAEKPAETVPAPTPLLGMPECKLEGKNLVITTKTGECYYSVMAITIIGEGESAKDELVGEAPNEQAVMPGSNLVIKGVCDKIKWTSGHPKAGSVYMIYVFAYDAEKR